MTKRNVIILLAALGASMTALCGLGVAGLAWLKPTLGAEPAWTVVHAPPPQFHVKTTARDLHFRELGFQDPHYELLFEVDDADAFLAANALTRGQSAPPAVTDAPVKASSAVELEGFVDDQLYRGGQLWEAGGRRFIYLVAFGT